MSLGADVAAILPALRAEAESLMVSACTCTRASGTPVLNETTGNYDPATPTTVYTGKCRVRAQDTVGREIDAQSQLLVAQRLVVSLPVDASAVVEVDDVFTITANPFDASVVGQSYRITGLHGQTHSTARRFAVELVS